MDFSRFRIITFDCYGTLIDWETGILGAFHSIFSDVDERKVLTLYSELEPAIQANGYKTYRLVLREVLARVADALGKEVPSGREDALADSISGWLPFPDTADALERLQTRYKLAIISNIDNDLFAHTARHLRVRFDHVITAQEVGAYKPSLTNFEAAEERIQTPRSEWLHAAESIYHDVVPAKQLGIANVWVNRRANRKFGATKMVAAVPDLEVRSLKALADAAGV
jgi:2-haloacid dehalogenase